MTALIVKVAVTVLAISKVMVHTLPDTVIHPVQFVRVDHGVGVAVRVTRVFRPYTSVQSVPQLMPVASIVPEPVPILATVRRGTFFAVNFATIDTF